MTRPRRAPLLDVDDIEVRYGAIAALKGISFNVGEGEIVALLGANGAGKTTTQKTVSGMLRPSLGSITFDGKRIDGIPAHELIRLGICHVPEGRHVFPRMTVAENLEMGAFRFKTVDQADLERVLELFPRLQGAVQAAGRHAVRRRAADARDRPGADGQAAPAAARRAVDGPGAADRRADLRDRPRDQPAAASPCCWSSRTPPRRWRWPTAATCWRPARSCSTGTGAELLADDRIRAAYLGEEIAAS